MVDRRKLIAGGGAAIALLLTGKAASAVSPAALRRITAAHARHVLDLVDPERGLVRPAGFQELLEHNYPIYRDSEPRDPKADDDLDAWMRGRVRDLCGTDDYADAVKDEKVRMLFGFTMLAYSQQQDPELPEIRRSMPVDDLLLRLEPGFLPELVGQLDDTAGQSPAFAAALEAGTAEFDRILDEGRFPERFSAQAMNDREMLQMVVGIAGFISFMYWVKRGLK
jgi:hypothetical protein